MNRILTCSLSLALATMTAAPLLAAPKDERGDRGRGRPAAAAPAQRPATRTVTTPVGRMNREIAAARESRPMRTPSVANRAEAQQRVAQQRAVIQQRSQQRAVAQQRATAQPRAQIQQPDLARQRATAQQQVTRQRLEAQQNVVRQRAEVQQRSLTQQRELAQRQETATEDWRRRADVARRSNELATNRALTQSRADRRDDDRRDRDWSDDDRRRWGRWDNDDRRQSWERYRYFRAPSWVYRNWDRNRSYWWNDHRYHWFGGNWVIIDPGYAYVDSYAQPIIGSNVVSEVQYELTRRGYYPGAVDGILGGQTRDAIAQFQADRGLPVTGRINQLLLDELGIV
jgi:hypothetical protein